MVKAELGSRTPLKIRHSTPEEVKDLRAFVESLRSQAKTQPPTLEQTLAHEPQLQPPRTRRSARTLPQT